METGTTIKAGDLLTATRAAKFLGVSRMTVWRWVRDGKISPIQVDNQRFFHIHELHKLRDERALAHAEPTDLESLEFEIFWGWRVNSPYRWGY